MYVRTEKLDPRYNSRRGYVRSTISAGAGALFAVVVQLLV